MKCSSCGYSTTFFDFTACPTCGKVSGGEPRPQWTSTPPAPEPTAVNGPPTLAAPTHLPVSPRYKNLVDVGRALSTLGSFLHVVSVLLGLGSLGVLMVGVTQFSPAQFGFNPIPIMMAFGGASGVAMAVMMFVTGSVVAAIGEGSLAVADIATNTTPR